MIVVEVVEELAGGVARVAQPHEVVFAPGAADDGFDADVVGERCDGREQLLEYLLRIVEDGLEGAIAVGLVDPGVDCVVFLEIRRPGRGRMGFAAAGRPRCRKPGGDSSRSCARRHPSWTKGR